MKRFLIAVLLIASIRTADAQMSTMPPVTHTVWEFKAYSVSQRFLFNGVSNRTPHVRDYFGIFVAGTQKYFQWCYMNGLTGKKNVPATALASGSCLFSDLKPGEYAVRVYGAGSTTDMLASHLFTVAPSQLEHRIVPADGVVTIERTKQSAALDKAIVKLGDGGTMTLLIDPTSVLKRVKVNYDGVATSTNVPATAAKPADRQRRNLSEP